MSCGAIEEGIYRLGRLGATIHPSRSALLREMAEIVSESVGIDVVGVAVYEDGLLAPATACYVHGPWGETQQRRFLEQSRWSPEERVLATRLAHRTPGRIYTRDELIEPQEFLSTRLYTELQRPLGISDQALARYQAPGGAELLFGICATDHIQRIPQQTIEQTRLIGEFLSRTWIRAWRREPEWMRSLKPTNRKVITLALRGFDDEQIAQELDLSYHAVRAHLKRAFRLAGVRSRLHLMQTLLQTTPQQEAPGAETNGQVDQNAADRANGTTTAA